MQPIRKQLVVDEDQRPIAVQIDLETFARIEEALEDRAMLALLEGEEEQTPLGREAALAYYATLAKGE